MSLVLTRVQDVVRDNANLDSNEARLQTTGLLDTFLYQTAQPNGIVTPELRDELFMSMGKTVKTPVIKTDGNMVVRSTRPLTISVTQKDSAFYTYTFTTVSVGFFMFKHRNSNNYISYDREFARNFLDVRRLMTDRTESLCYTFLDTLKTQAIAKVTGGMTYAGNVVSETAPSYKESTIINQLTPMMRSNRYDVSGGMDIIGSQGLDGIMRNMQGFGTFNAENRTLQFGNNRYHFSNEVVDAAGKAATGFAIADGQLGIVARPERESLYRTKTSTGKQWDTIPMPGLGLEVGTFYWDDAVDVASILGTADVADMTRGVQEFFDFSFDLCLFSKYNSAPSTNASPIIKFDIGLA